MGALGPKLATCVGPARAALVQACHFRRSPQRALNPQGQCWQSIVPAMLAEAGTTFGWRKSITGQRKEGWEDVSGQGVGGLGGGGGAGMCP